MNNYSIAVIKGDGIGPETVSEAMKVLEKVGSRNGHRFNFTELLAGGAAIDAKGEPLPKETIEKCLESDSILLGAVGGEKWEGLPGHLRPERAILGLRYELGLYANIRPAKLFPSLIDECPLKESIAAKGFDMVFVRELTGGIYFGDRGRRNGPYGEEAYDEEKYSRMEVSRIGRIAFDMAAKRGKSVISVDKANVLESSRLWREEMHRLKTAYPEISYRDMFVDNAAMQLVREPSQFDVVVTSNLFGDILSDEASMITGSIGLLPSASLGEGKRGLYEPIHGSAPDIAGKGIANPIATILSCAMMLRYSFGLDKEADSIEKAVDAALMKGLRTADIAGGNKAVSTKEMATEILNML